VSPCETGWTPVSGVSKAVAAAQIVFSGLLLFLPPFWHCDLLGSGDLARPPHWLKTRRSDLPKIFGIHLLLAVLAASVSAAFHLTGSLSGDCGSPDPLRTQWPPSRRCNRPGGRGFHAFNPVGELWPTTLRRGSFRHPSPAFSNITTRPPERLVQSPADGQTSETVLGQCHRRRVLPPSSWLERLCVWLSGHSCGVVRTHSAISGDQGYFKTEIQRRVARALRDNAFLQGRAYCRDFLRSFASLT